MYGPHFVYPSSIHGHTDCFHLLAVVNNAAVNIILQISVQDPAFISFGYTPRCGIAGPYGSSLLKFLRTCFQFCVEAAQFTFPPTVHEGPSFSIPLPMPVFFLWITAVLTAGVLICISLMTSDVEPSAGT